MFLLLTCNSHRLSFLEGAFKDAWGKRKTRGGAVCQFPESFDQILILRVLCCTVSAPQMILPTQEVVQHIVVGALDALPPPPPTLTAPKYTNSFWLPTSTFLLKGFVWL